MRAEGSEALIERRDPANDGQPHGLSPAVDGHSVIFAWPELRALQTAAWALAREAVRADGLRIERGRWWVSTGRELHEPRGPRIPDLLRNQHGGRSPVHRATRRGHESPVRQSSDRLERRRRFLRRGFASGRGLRGTAGRGARKRRMRPPPPSAVDRPPATVD